MSLAKASLWTAASTLVKIGAGLLVGKLLAVSFGPAGLGCGKFPPVDYRARRACRGWASLTVVTKYVAQYIDNPQQLRRVAALHQRWYLVSLR